MALPAENSTPIGMFPDRYIWSAPSPAEDAPRPVPPQKRPRLDPARWPEIAARASYESLRDLAIEFGVSHETIRTVIRRTVKEHEDIALATD